ncbi:MAG TPA: adenylate/guanylate cyclase domain-containing protein [Sphingomicrobium sp.]|nr:adenylate/guanylate cyclase domain-containing protein [Sphingomicrobium sp.]
MERRLTAILAADVVGYSRLMGANEVGTLQSLQQHQAELVVPEITRHGGRIVKLTGDGLLAEFPSVVGAVECAVAVQQSMPARNLDVPEDRRIEYRIGINLDDVIVQGDDLFGDGVNIAARLEGIARPGGIAVSKSVRDNVENRLDVLFEDRGDQRLKNIAMPVRVFDINLGAGIAPAMMAEAMAMDKPSIAVLPFTNMSGDPEQEYFSDGITEDIITDLSKISALFVVGRHTSFAYKNMAAHLDRIAAELGVNFLVEGSVRKAGNRIRITAQLIEGCSGGHLWADRFDRDLTDIFAIQDEITRAIVEQLRIRLLPEEMNMIGQPPTDNVEAYSLYLKGRDYFHNPTTSFLELAKQMFRRALDLDPSFARAYAGIANCDARLVGWYGHKIPLDDILAMAGRALELDPRLAEAHAARGEALRVAGRNEAAVDEFERALELDPNSFEANLAYARYARGVGDLKQSAALFIRALEVQPSDYQAPLLLQSILTKLGCDDEAMEYARLGLERAEEELRLHPEASRPAQLAAPAAAMLGDREAATRWIERALWIDPDDPQALYNVACAWSMLGEVDRALDTLEKWSQRGGVLARNWLERDPDLDPIRSHPRYASLIERIESSVSQQVQPTA